MKYEIVYFITIYRMKIQYEFINYKNTKKTINKNK